MSSRQWVQSPRLGVHLGWLLPQLEPKAQAIAHLVDAGWQADFFCFSYGIPTEPPAPERVIRDRASALGPEIVFDHYAASESEAGDQRQE